MARKPRLSDQVIAGNTVRQKAQTILAAAPEKLAAAKIAWKYTHAEIENRAAAKRPKPLNYEVHHEIEKAREAFMAAIVEGKSIASCEIAARRAVGLKVIDLTDIDNSGVRL